MNDKKIAHLLDKIKYLTEKCQEQERKIKLLEEAKFSYEYILANIPSHVYWLDKNNTYLGCNDAHAKTVGLKSRKEIIGKTNYDMPWKEQADELNKVNNIVKHEGKVISYEEKVFMDNKLKTYVSKKAPLRDKKNNIIGVLGISIDITDRKQMESELNDAKKKAESANHTKTQFIANMSHDIRTPLSGVVGLGNIVEKQIADPSIKAKVHDMVKSAEQLLTMLNEILEVISLDSVSINDIQEEPFDLRYLVATIIDLEQSSVDLKEIKLISNIDSSIPQVLISDHKKIHHIILNLVSNAIKFTPKGQITISIQAEEVIDDKVKLTFQVSDTGVGIPDAAMSKLFDLFYKYTPSYQELEHGNGIGLHIVKTYTELLGGKISVDSTPNHGSSFSFSLVLKIAPKNTKPANIIATPEVTPNLTGDLENCKITPQILLIEDNDIARTVAKTLITEAHCHCTSCADAEEAMPIAQTQNFDLIITDVGLPGMSGIEFAQQIRKNEAITATPPTPIIALTGHAEGKYAEECHQAGINDVIVKPLRPEHLQQIFAKFTLFTNQPTAPPENFTDKTTDNLPNNNQQLFDIEDELIFDIKNARKIIGENNTDLLLPMLKDTLTTTIPSELPKIKTAHANNDWQEIASIAHKLKGGFLAISLARAAKACKYLEQYYHSGQTEHLEQLYQQLLNSIDATTSRLQEFI